MSTRVNMTKSYESDAFCPEQSVPINEVQGIFMKTIVGVSHLLRMTQSLIHVWKFNTQ